MASNIPTRVIAGDLSNAISILTAPSGYRAILNTFTSPKKKGSGMRTKPSKERKKAMQGLAEMKEERWMLTRQLEVLAELETQITGTLKECNDSIRNCEALIRSL